MTGTLTPQDEGMGAADADWVDAAAVAQLAFDPNVSDFRVSGMDVSADFTNDEVSVATGVARLTAPTAGGKNDGDRSNVLFAAEITSAMTAALADASGTNYVYLDADPSTLDGLSIVVNSTGTAPSEPSLLLATVDASAETVTQENTLPDGAYQGLSVEDVPSDQTDVARKAELDGKADSNADAADFGGSSGTDGQVLTTDGTDATWQDASGGGGGGGMTELYSQSHSNVSGDIDIFAPFTPGTYKEYVFVFENVVFNDFSGREVYLQVSTDGSTFVGGTSYNCQNREDGSRLPGSTGHVNQAEWIIHTGQYDRDANDKLGFTTELKQPLGGAMTTRFSTKGLHIADDLSVQSWGEGMSDITAETEGVRLSTNKSSVDFDLTIFGIA